MNTANLASVLGRACRPDARALIDLAGTTPQIYSYRDLNDRASRVAGALLAEGYGHGDRIGMLNTNSVHFYSVYFGGLMAGCTVVPFNARAGADTVAHVCQDAALKLLVTDAEPPAGVPKSLPVVQANSPAFVQWLSHAPAPMAQTDAESTAIVLYTSGSTGRPKGVMLSHRSQIAIVDGLAQPAVRGFLERGPCIVAAPLFHMNGLVFSELAFAIGGEIVLMPRFDAQAFIRALADYRVTVLSGVPTMVALLAQERELLASVDLSSVELVMIGSAPLSETVLAQASEIFPRAAIINSYGTTEIGAGILGAHPAGLPRPTKSIGYPSSHAEIRLVDGGAPDEGVFEIRSPANMSGYLNLPEVTAQKMRGGWINTGDIMRRDENGFLYFVGRADDMFVCSGENIYPGEVERLLERHPAILEVCIVPLPDDIRGQIPVAFVVVRPGATLSDQDVKGYVIANAAPHLYPRRVCFLDKMPLSGVNKIDRHVLKSRARDLATGT